PGPVGRAHRDRMGRRPQLQVPARARRWEREDAPRAARPGSTAARPVSADRPLLYRAHHRAHGAPVRVTTTDFDPSAKMIIVRAVLWGPDGEAPLSLVLDTGSWQTLIVPDIMDDLGFNPRDG